MDEQKNRVALPGSERVARPGSRVVGTPDPNQQITITVLVRPRKPIESLATSTELGATPPSQRNYLTREQFAEEYGASAEDLAQVQAFAARNGLTVTEVSAARRTVLLSGTIAALGQAFGVQLANYEHPGGDFRGRTGAIYLPPDLSG